MVRPLGNDIVFLTVSVGTTMLLSASVQAFSKYLAGKLDNVSGVTDSFSDSDFSFSDSDFSFTVLLDGKFETSYTEANNSPIIPTDTVKNTIYVLAKKSSNVQIIERFGYEIGQHFINRYSHVNDIHIKIIQHRGTRVDIDGQLHPHSFFRNGEDTRRVELLVSRSSNVTVESRLKHLLVLKSTGSNFINFHLCEHTTLQDAHDRIFSTSVDAKWTYSLDKSKIESILFDEITSGACEITLGIFATNDSTSVQATMYKMGERGC
ncbi:hypothetical protein K7432_002224 [Basidiobolus ranarum]|uniref:Uricase n=1 Tax=Basidiobolus ranarum TaxID=34480 RepID=A0ABR2X1V1_9FUNG